MVSGASLNDQLAHGSVICDKAGTSWRQGILEQRYLLYRNKETKGRALKKQGEGERAREHKPFKSHSLSDPLLTQPPFPHSFSCEVIDQFIGFAFTPWQCLCFHSVSGPEVGPSSPLALVSAYCIHSSCLTLTCLSVLSLHCTLPFPFPR